MLAESLENYRKSEENNTFLDQMMRKTKHKKKIIGTNSENDWTHICVTEMFGSHIGWGESEREKERKG